MLTLAQHLTPEDRMQLAWLARMAGVGCIHEGLSAWGAQLLQDAQRLQQDAEREQAGGGR